jgi:hydroxyacylglutathione hydrolase
MNEEEFFSKEENLRYPNVWDIEPKEIKIIDVRMEVEFNCDLGHIPNSQLVRLDVLSQQLDKFAKDDSLVFICRNGGRSARAASLFVKKGFTKVFNLKGGMLYWREHNYEVEGNSE